ncbi:MAG: epoxyqueuosine reductase QueH, partial [Clostridia bacterium]|nr:epoxyqueuosine reductase QueH [Clostridia bacterium]
MARGLEEEPERGKRCYLCYELRLKKTAEVAKERGYDYFCTTLTLSPHKNADWL